MAVHPTPALVTQWKAEYNAVRGELLDLLITRTILGGTIRVLERRRGKCHPIACYGGFVHDSLRRSYATYGAVAVRRMVDTDKGTVSLKRLLISIRDHPGVLTRA
ncbi:MAG TPA: hypothetical protein VEP50_15615 [bacterium]|nr:hypothetical protein [bacterium]